MRVSVADLNLEVQKALLHYGYSEQETELIARVLIYAQLRGNNQGIVKLIGVGMPKHQDTGRITTVKETSLSVLLDGQHSQGILVMSQAVEIAMDKAQHQGFGIAGTFNSHTTTGAIGYYAREIAQQDMIGFVFSGSTGVVATYGSYQPFLGTNPIAVGVPTAKEPIVLDLATSAMAYYGLVEAATAGRSIPDNIAYDKDGHPTTDPQAALSGALRSFDRSYKGAGLALIFEALTGPLVRAGFGANNVNWGNLVYIINPIMLVDDVGIFKRQMSEFIQRVKESKKLPGVTEIMIPGEIGDRAMQAALRTGYVEIEDKLWNKLLAVTQEADN